MQARVRAPPVEEAEKGLTILLADDEPSLRAAIAEYLRGAEQRVLESQSARDALELARKEAGTIDVLLTDVVMPGLRGTNLVKEVLALRPGIQILCAKSGRNADTTRSGVSTEAISFGVFGRTA